MLTRLALIVHHLMELLQYRTTQVSHIGEQQTEKQKYVKYSEDVVRLFSNVCSRHLEKSNTRIFVDLEVKQREYKTYHVHVHCRTQCLDLLLFSKIQK